VTWKLYVVPALRDRTVADVDALAVTTVNVNCPTWFIATLIDAPGAKVTARYVGLVVNGKLAPGVKSAMFPFDGEFVNVSELSVMVVDPPAGHAIVAAPFMPNMLTETVLVPVQVIVTVTCDIAVSLSVYVRRTVAALAVRDIAGASWSLSVDDFT